MSNAIKFTILVVAASFLTEGVCNAQEVSQANCLYAIEVFVMKTPQNMCEPGIHCFEAYTEGGEQRFRKRPEKCGLDFDEAWWFGAYPEFRRALIYLLIPSNRRTGDPDESVTAILVVDFDSLATASFYPNFPGTASSYHFPIVRDGTLWLGKRRVLVDDSQIGRAWFVLQNIETGDEREAPRDEFRHILKGEAVTLGEDGMLRFDRFGFQDVLFPHLVPEEFSEPFTKFGIFWNDGRDLMFSCRKPVQGRNSEKTLFWYKANEETPFRVYSIDGYYTSTMYRRPWLLNRVRHGISRPPEATDYTGEWIVIDTRDDWSTRFTFELGEADDLIGYTDRYLFFRKDDSLISVDLQHAREEGSPAISTIYTGESVRNYRVVFEAPKQPWPPEMDDGTQDGYSREF